jgi:hypothetical protein
MAPPVLTTGVGIRLPAQLTHFVGRTRELVDVHRLLASSRLLTLTGVGGSGKTRSLGQPERTATLLGAAESLRDSMSAPLPPAEKTQGEKTRAAARSALGDASFDTATERGRKYSLAC